MTRALATLLLLASPVARAQTCADVWRAPLHALVGDGETPRYDALAREPARSAMRRAVACVETTDPATLRTDAERLAFWINAYNIRMVQNVLDAPRTTNVLDRRDAFFRTPYRFAGQNLTLDDVENGLLRRQSAALRRLAPSRLDARIHAGLFCGAVSCPPLQPAPFTPEAVNAQLDAATRAWVNSPRFARTSGRAAVFSSLLDWFGADFDAAGGGKAGDFFVRYLPPSSPFRARLAGRTAAQIKADTRTTFAYDWALARR